MNLLQQIQGVQIEKESDLFEKIQHKKRQNEQLVASFGTTYKDATMMREIMYQATGRKVDDSTTISFPFYTDFGQHIFLRKNIFINKNVTFVDIGGIYIADKVLIGPSAKLITANHLLSPKKRGGIHVLPVRIKENAWIGANATILPGVTVGKNAIVAANATVTKDVPDNVIVAGNPARQIKTLEIEE